MNYVTQIIQSIRVPNVNEVEKLHAQLKNDRRFELKKFEYQHKEIKEKKEVVDEFIKLTHQRYKQELGDEFSKYLP